MNKPDDKTKELIKLIEHQHAIIEILLKEKLPYFEGLKLLKNIPEKN